MSTPQKRFRFSLFKYVIIGIICITSLSLVAGTSAASLSISETLMTFFGVTTSSQKAQDRQEVVSTTLVISQFDGGGGGSTGTYLNDYVELKNISSAPQSLNGLSL